MRLALAAGSVAAVALGNLFFAPLTVVVATLAIAIGVAVHELMHWLTAHAVAAEDVEAVWTGRPEIRYTATPAQIRVVNLAPALLGLGLLAYTIWTPSPSAAWLLIDCSFCVGLIGWSPADWMLSRATQPTAS